VRVRVADKVGRDSEWEDSVGYPDDSFLSVERSYRKPVFVRQRGSATMLLECDGGSNPGTRAARSR
jgi:hypothetical protein